jgi:hypothetical protein
MTADVTSPDLRPLIERFAKSFAAFVKAAGDAVSEAANNPELAAAPAYQSWKGKVLPLLLQENASLEAALAQFQAGDARPVLVSAEDKRGLAKDMDGFPLTFAGPDHAQILGDLRIAVVRSASRLCAAAGIP